MFVTAEAHAHVRFRRAIERRALWLAEDAARELPNLPLEDALQLVHLYAERGSPSTRRPLHLWHAAGFGAIVVLLCGRAVRADTALPLVR